ncbi:hypothetical protein [Tropicimonas sp. IMCC34011]|uniref:hypothetical protein n=1 Tax=Tropicimonas sp. IMCC34011 TaxID=2248759 RepID=UPI000E242935|nr:hypothetical protein [Tropicimonas sp. IMCC34011]
MSNFSTPFAANTPERRRPNAEEQSLGFPCGPSDRELFNGLIHTYQAEIKSVATEAGVTGSDADYNLLRDSIVALIEAATGGGDPSSYLTEAIAKSRLPFHAEVETADNKLGVQSPGSGIVRVPGGVDFVHRGIVRVSTAQTDLGTSANSTYHLRWTAAGGFVLKSLADPSYNPGALSETATAFDGTYDDLLFARVTTNASNIPTITDLRNAANLLDTVTANATNVQNSGKNFARGDVRLPINWARTPRSRSITMITKNNDGDVNDQDRLIFALGGYGGTQLTDYPVDRYGCNFTQVEDFMTSMRLSGAFGG